MNTRKSRKFLNTRNIALAGMIAAMYVALVYVLAEFSFFAFQLRVAEVLTILPFIFPAAIPGVFVGCLVSNILLSPLGLPDYIFTPLATLAAAYLTSRCKTRWLAPLPPVILNAIAVSAILTLFDPEVLSSMGASMSTFIAIGLSIFVSQAIVCAGLGIPLLYAIEKLKLQERFLGKP